MNRRRSRQKNNVAKLDTKYTQQQEQYLERKDREKRLLMRRLIAFGILFFVIVGSLSAYYIQQKSVFQNKQEEYRELEEELEAYQEENESLTREIELLNDVDYLLQIARKDYFFSKEGEIIFTLPDEEPSY
ncbi:FtsB family cell division protein [Alkalibacillus aidingensis]|uniref:FtsB family cell division protein n=1 Tax=Alkalibacillus aidingensis TaxID=2747607 RepID=UPI001660B4A9|nr:septum formation initiator family protein [Alkalibacillus aidingensis]